MLKVMVRYGLNYKYVECNGLMDLEFAEFAKENETLLELGVDGITICFEVEFVVDCCPKASICVYPFYRLGPYGSLLLVILSW
jgi:hypothetical protein